MNTSDSVVTTEFIWAFNTAWRKSTKDYSDRIINSEHTLQSSVYHHLRSALRDDFRVFTEAVIQLPESVAAESEKRKIIVDLLVCYKKEIVAAIEIKYTPRGMPATDSVRKDILSLSRITNRLRLIDRVSVEMPRFRSSESAALVLSISPIRKLIFAAYCSKDSIGIQKQEFWGNFRPSIGYWKESMSMPKNLGVALSHADDQGEAECEFYGGPFDRVFDGF